MLLHYFLGKIKAKFCFMSKCEENIEGHNFVLRDRTCKKSVASDFVIVFIITFCMSQILKMNNLDKTCENEEGVAKDRRMANARQ